MRYCHQCHRITTGDPLFCNSCGRSYNTKLCPSRHPNPRSAQLCSQCGSRELSSPQPPIPMSLRLMFLLLWVLAGVVTLYIALVLISAVLHAFASNAQLQLDLVIVCVVVLAVGWLYMQLPVGLRKFVSKLWKGRKQDGKDKHGHA